MPPSAVPLHVCTGTTRAMLIPCVPCPRRKSRHENAPCRRGPPAHRLLVAGRPRPSHPPITGAPVIDAPANVLAWPVDDGVREPSLSEATANRLNDLHATFDACDMALTTAGNYHMALTELWHTVYLPAFDPPLRNWFYTTSPPIVRRQLQHGVVQLGNVNVTCRPKSPRRPGHDPGPAGRRRDRG